MKTIQLTFILILTSLTCFAQVGIGNTDPKASLDITASNAAAPSNTDGILIPRIDVFPSTDPTTDQTGMLVYLTTYDGTNFPGFYYWTGGSWKTTKNIYTATNGIIESSNNFRLGGSLTNSTYINFASYGLTYILDGSSYSSFNIQDVGSRVFSIGSGNSNGITTFGQDTYWKDGSTSATTLGRFYGLSSGISVLDLYQSGVVSTRIRSNGTSYFKNSNLAIGTSTSTNFKLDVQATSSNYVANFEQLYSSSQYTSGVAIRLGYNAPNTNSRYLSLFRNANFTNYEAGKITGSASGTGVLYATTSDSRLKTNIENISNALELIDQIEPKLYEYKEFLGIKEYGFLAQNLQTVYPQAVSGSPDSDPTKNPMMVDYGRLTPILTVGIKELHKEVLKLKNENEFLLQKLNKLEQLEARLSALEANNR